MISYLARTLPKVLVAKLKAPSVGSVISRRVRLHEIDFLGHMNQAMYSKVAEYGRVRWSISTGAWVGWRDAGFTPVVAQQDITYRRELKLGTTYSIDTRAVGFDGRMLVAHTHLIVGDKVHALIVVKLLFIGPNGVLSSSQIQEVAKAYLEPPLSVKSWRVHPPVPTSSVQ